VSLETEILVVGGGIGGVVLAELLARARKRVVVVERSVGPPPFLRPEVLWPSAAQTLFALRDRSEWERDSFRPVGGVTLDRGGRLQPVITAANLRTAGIEPFFENPNQTRETLLAKCQAEVRRGVEVVEVVHDAGAIRGVQARHRETGELICISAGLTVGDDGADSRVRAACGIEISLEPFPVDFFVCGFPWPAIWTPDVAHVMFPPREDQSGLLAVAFIPVPPALTAPVAVVRADLEPDSAALAAAWKAMLAVATSAPPELHALDFPGGFTKIGRRWGHAAQYGVPGAVLIGDALHPVSPAGGQGANMAIADAVALARLIIGGSSNLARDFEAARRAPNERGIRPTRLAARVFRAQRHPWIASLTSLLLPRIVGFPGLVPAALRLLARGSANAA
jgi:2-polyprenyl-6-methoxyphenol hydroxylase-like FAD-dependent oxidoreductase